MVRFSKQLLALIGIGLVVQVGGLVWAAETTTTTAMSTAAQPATPAADASAPVIRPIVIKFSGEIVTSATGMLTVRDRYGVTKEMLVDSSTAKVMHGTIPGAVGDLKAGDQVTVDYVYDVSTGKRNVQKVMIPEAAAGTAPAASTGTAPAAPSTSAPAAKQ